MKTTLLALLFVAPFAKADVITCSFTEPFYTITYDTNARTMTVKNEGENETDIIQDVELMIRNAGQFDLIKSGKVFMTLNLSHHGSDGMSEFVYPYEAKFYALDKMANNGVGGCESLLLKKAKN